jgi:hypothetical protein
LLAHRDRNKIADLHQLGLAEVLVQSIPQFVGGGQVPGNCFRVGQRRFLPLVVTRGAFEIDQIGIVILH